MKRNQIPLLYEVIMLIPLGPTHTAFAFAKISFDVCPYLPLLCVNSTIDNNGTQMESQKQKQTQMLGTIEPL